MLGALLLAVALSAAPSDEAIYREGTSTLRLTQKACTSREVLAQIKPEWHGRFRAARVTKLGPVYFDACWILRPDGVVLVQFPDGALEVDATAFHIAKGL